MDVSDTRPLYPEARNPIRRQGCLVAGCPCQDARIVSQRKARFYAEVARTARGDGPNASVLPVPDWAILTSDPPPLAQTTTRARTPAGAAAPLRSRAMATTPPLNDDYERRAVLAGDDADAARSVRARAARPRPTSSSSVAATRASTPPASSPGAASRSPCSRPTRWAGAPRRATAGSSMPATSGAPASSSSTTARTPARRSTRRRSTRTSWSSSSSPTRAIDCEFREVGHLELAYAPVARPGAGRTPGRAWPPSA